MCFSLLSFLHGLCSGSPTPVGLILTPPLVFASFAHVIDKNVGPSLRETVILSIILQTMRLASWLHRPKGSLPLRARKQRVGPYEIQLE